MTRVVILGATGDLAGRYLLPALAQLEAAGRAPDLEVFAVAQENWGTESFRQHARERLDAHAGAVPEDARASLLERMTYAQADVTESTSLAPLFDGARENVAYLALPPAVFGSAIEALSRIDRRDLRIVLEKPFGTSLASAQNLNRRLLERFAERQIFRMDHFLGKQTVQNLLGIRFANRVFEPLWSYEHIEAIDIIWDETVALEGRSGYYDRTGALRDMIQNHLLQLLALVAFEQPSSLRAEELRDAKVELLRRVAKPDHEDVAETSVRARYTSGTVAGHMLPNYVDEPGVDPSRGTETFAEVTLYVENDRWEGVPFRLRTGKALGAARREIHVHFRPVDPLPFAPDDDLLPNRLVLSMDPDRMALDFALNGAGDPFRLEPARLDLDLAPQGLSAYARLILDVMEGDPALSIRGDEAEECWRVVEPILEAWQLGKSPLTTYEAGSQGPEASRIPPPEKDSIGARSG